MTRRIPRRVYWDVDWQYGKFWRVLGECWLMFKARMRGRYIHSITTPEGTHHIYQYKDANYRIPDKAGIIRDDDS